MEEFFVNDFVVNVESGHPGYVSYQIIAKPESWRMLSAELAAAVERCERTDKSKKRSATFPASGSRDVWQNGEFPLLSKRASISKGKTSRVSFSFSATEDLGIHHVRPTRLKSFWNNFSCLLLGLALFGMLYLAGVGVSKILGDFINAW